jgi:hypothetical protein
MLQTGYLVQRLASILHGYLCYLIASEKEVDATHSETFHVINEISRLV